MKKEWMEKLYRLLDITTCRCPITLCSEMMSTSHGKKENCKAGAHIVCVCPRETKLPAIELTWVRLQRDKSEEKSVMGMLNRDTVEEKKMVKKDEGKKRKLKLKEGEEKWRLNEKKLCEEASVIVDYEIEELEDVKNKGKEKEINEDKEEKLMRGVRQPGQAIATCVGNE